MPRRTVEAIQKDIEEALRAYNSMANIQDAEPEGKGIFLDNVSRHIRELQKELKEAQVPSVWDRLQDD